MAQLLYLIVLYLTAGSFDCKDKNVTEIYSKALHIYFLTSHTFFLARAYILPGFTVYI